MQRIGAPKWTEAELEFAREMTKSFAPGQKEAFVRAAKLPAAYVDKYLHDEILPAIDKGEIMKGSTDVADVSWCTPTAQINTCCTPIGSPGHSWQIVASSGTSIAHQGLVLAAKTMALTGSELLRRPDLIQAARAEFEAATAGHPYVCAIPADVNPPLDQLPKQE